MKETHEAVAVAPTRDDASRIFGRAFDDLRLESYAVADSDVEPDVEGASAVGLSGGAAMLPLLHRILDGSIPTVRELHVHLDDDVRDTLSADLSAATGWIVTDIAHAEDGKPVIALRRQLESGPLLPLSLEGLSTTHGAGAAWPSISAPAAPTAPAATGEERPAAPAPAARSPRRRLPVLNGRTRRIAQLAVALGVLAVIVLVVVGLVAGFEALVVVLLIGIAVLVAVAVVGVAYAVRLLIRMRLDQGHQAEMTERSLRMLRKSMQRATERNKRTMALLRRNDESIRAILGAQDTAQEYLATFAAQQTEAQATSLERDRVARLAGQRQVQALLHLDRLVQPAAVPPMGGWAASPDLLALCLDLLLERRPRCVVETGSGVSTLYLAAAIEAHGLDCRVVALEHDESFANATRELLARNGLAHRAEVRFAPLVPTGLPDHPTLWYDRAALADLADIGMLLVDGPPEATGPEPRYPAVPLLHDRLAERCVIVADDIIRATDRRTVERWTAELLTDFDHTLRTDLEKHAAVLRRG